VVEAAAAAPKSEKHKSFYCYNQYEQTKQREPK